MNNKFIMKALQKETNKKTPPISPLPETHIIQFLSYGLSSFAAKVW